MAHETAGESADSDTQERDLTLTLFIFGMVGTSGIGLFSFFLVFLALLGDPFSLRMRLDQVSGRVLGLEPDGLRTFAAARKPGSTDLEPRVKRRGPAGEGSDRVLEPAVGYGRALEPAVGYGRALEPASERSGRLPGGPVAVAASLAQLSPGGSRAGMPLGSSSLEPMLQAQVLRILRRHLSRAGLEEGAVVLLRPSTGEILAAAALPGDASAPTNLEDLSLPLYPPGSTLKVLTAMAAIRHEPSLMHTTYRCGPLEGGRVGIRLASAGRSIRDDEKQRRPHGEVNLETALALSCNAFFAQLAVRGVRAEALLETASLFGIELARPNTVEELDKTLEQASFGQGEVLASPLAMARVAATVAGGGLLMPPTLERGGAAGRFAGRAVLSPSQSALLARAMRKAVEAGTARVLNRPEYPAIAGKTGTAEVEGDSSHSWFIGYAPHLETVYGVPYPATRQVAFAVVVPGAGYGAEVAAPLAGELVAAAREAGVID